MNYVCVWGAGKKRRQRAKQNSGNVYNKASKTVTQKRKQKLWNGNTKTGTIPLCRLCLSKKKDARLKPRKIWQEEDLLRSS